MRPVATLAAALLLLLLPPADARAAEADDAGGAPPPAAWLADLPAVSGDGRIVAVANHESLGARGDERLLLDFIDIASDRLVRRIIVSDPDHPESRAGAEAKARAMLGERTWVKLHKLGVREDPGAPLRQGTSGAFAQSNLASGGGLEVQYREPALAVRDTTISADLVRKKEPTWSHPGGPRCPGCDVCPAPLAILADAWADRLHGVVLVDVSYAGGSDICWEPPDDFHAVELPPTIPHP
jgi:hypothetical protein